LAIEKGQEQLAVNLIHAGADIHLNATIEKTQEGFMSLFSPISYQEKTALEMAVDYKRPQVIRVLQLALLDEYIEQREQEEEYLSQFRLFGCLILALGCISLFGIILGLGYSKTTKLEKAREFREMLLNDDVDEASFKRIHQDALAEGRLGEIVKLSTHYLNDNVPIPQSHFSPSTF
ncbi:hypothetical protein, partial [Legionella maceachernii]